MIYTDNIHLIADSLHELHAFAYKIGLHYRYFHGVRKGHPHYDLITKGGNPVYDSFKISIKFKAYLHGAIHITKKELLLKSKSLL